MRACMHVCMFEGMCRYIYIYLCVHTYIYIHVYIYVHMCTYSYNLIACLRICMYGRMDAEDEAVVQARAWRLPRERARGDACRAQAAGISVSPAPMLLVSRVPGLRGIRVLPVLCFYAGLGVWG